MKSPLNAIPYHSETKLLSNPDYNIIESPTSFLFTKFKTNYN